jgi:integrase
VLVHELRDLGLAESSAAKVIAVTGQVYRYAARRLAWAGTSPVTLMLPSERPRVGQTQRRGVYEGEQLAQVIATAREPWRTLFTLAALTGGRVSELLGLTWADVRLDDLDDAEVEFGWQVDRAGMRQPTKTDGSARTVPITRDLAFILATHKLATAEHPAGGVRVRVMHRSPFGQRNVGRALREAQRRAVDADGMPTYPVLHERDARGQRVPSHAVRFPQCTRSATRSRAADCSPVRASTRSHSYSATAMAT